MKKKITYLFLLVFLLFNAAYLKFNISYADQQNIEKNAKPRRKVGDKYIMFE